MTYDEIPEMPYRPKSEPLSPLVRERYWKTAFGLQAVDGLAPSVYAQELARDNINGILSIDEVGRLLHQHYRSSAHEQSFFRTQEADLVSRRIVEVLEDGTFVLDPTLLPTIHHTLFQDLDPELYHPGVFKTEQLIKPEIVLNGDSVFYAPPSMCHGMLNALFAQETAHAYGYDFDATDCANFSTFIARVWQVHPFYGGNTRTIAVFSELYLGELGFSVGNDLFEQHAAYFRDALVRANYRNRAIRVEFDLRFLERFFASAVHGTPAEFNRQETLCRPLFENPNALRNATLADAAEVRSYLERVDRA